MSSIFIELERGILHPGHRKKIGNRIWLYLYIRANDKWNPIDAARDLDMNISLVKQQARELAVMDYIFWNKSFYKHARKVKIPGKLKWIVWERDDFTCKACGIRRNLSVDHIVPESKGGLTELNNLQTLCKSCNSKKGIKPEG